MMDLIYIFLQKTSEENTTLSNLAEVNKLYERGDRDNCKLVSCHVSIYIEKDDRNIEVDIQVNGTDIRSI